MRAKMPTFDSIQEYELAMEDRLYDGVMLWGFSARNPGAIYLLGYAAGIALKCAYFRFTGFAIAQPIGHPELATAAAQARQLGVETAPESYHSVRFWAELLVAMRYATDRPLNATLTGDLRAAADAIYERWWVEMRYKRGYSFPTSSRVRSSGRSKCTRGG